MVAQRWDRKIPKYHNWDQKRMRIVKDGEEHGLQMTKLKIGLTFPDSSNHNKASLIA